MIVNRLFWWALMADLRTGFQFTAIRRPAAVYNRAFHLLAGGNAHMADWLEDIIYGGDIQGAIQRRAKDVVNDDFLDYLDEQVQTADDADMEEIIATISSIIYKKLELNEGMVDAGEVFEKRLDKILFTPPAKRKEFIENNKKDMTGGFIDYVQKELKAADDMDSKVVIASILQMIGQVKETDLLGSDASILQSASLSEDSVGLAELILDGSMSTDELQRSVAEGKEIQLGDRNEQVIAIKAIYQHTLSVYLNKCL